MRHCAKLALILLIFVIGIWLLYPAKTMFGRPRQLHGGVQDETGPVAGPRVRFQGDLLSTLSKVDGTINLPGIPENSRQVTAWKQGFFIAGSSSDASPLTLKLIPLPVKDNESYSWVDPAPDATHKQNCGNCHGEIYDEWSASGHSRSAANRRFLNLFDGTDWQGRAHVGWSLRDDHPDGIGVCNACHAPTAPFDADLRNLSGIS